MRFRHLTLLLLVVLTLPALAVDLLQVDPVERATTPEPVLEAIDAARATVEATAGRPPIERAAAFGQLGDVLYAHGFATPARQAYLNARSLAPSVPDWHYLLGIVAIDAGRLDAAVDHFSTAIELNPFDALALIRRGQVRLDQGELEQAAPDFERALSLAPEAPAALAGMGRVALHRGEHREAADYFERALAISPEATRLHQPLAMAYRGLGEVERAREHLGRVGEGTEPVADPLLQRIQSQSRSPQFYLEMALARAAAGDLDSARQLLITALHLAPDDALVIENYGEVAARQGDLEQASAAFQRLAEIQPAAAQPLFLLGQVEELRQRPEQAGQAYREALQREPAHVPAREALAFVHLGAGDFSGAEAIFSELAERPQHQGQSRFAYWAALAMLGGGDCARGHGALEALRREFPTDAEVLLALARVRASCAEVAEAELREALEWTEEVYQIAPSTEHAASLAMVYAALGQFDDAVDLQAQAMFEALKQGELEQRADLRADMQRYQEGRPASVPFAPGYPGFPLP